MIIRILVAANSFPVHGLGCSEAVLEKCDNFAITPRSIGPSLLQEGEAGQGHFKPCPEFDLRQVSLIAPSFKSMRVHNKEGRSPKDAESVKGGGIILDVGLNGYEFAMYEGRGFIIGKRFGLQPNAASSARCGAEIKQYRPVFSRGLGQGRINILYPLHAHLRTLLSIIIKFFLPEPDFV